MSDHPFWETAVTAKAWVDRGATIHQKFTCAGCGARLTIEAPNTFHKTGTCDQCDTVTDIEAQGCNYLLIFPPVDLGSVDLGRRRFPLHPEEGER